MLATVHIIAWDLIAQKGDACRPFTLLWINDAGYRSHYCPGSDRPKGGCLSAARAQTHARTHERTRRMRLDSFQEKIYKTGPMMVGHQHMGPAYIVGHNYMGHNYVGHNCVGHNYKTGADDGP